LSLRGFRQLSVEWNSQEQDQSDFHRPESFCPQFLAKVEHQLHLPLFNLALHIVNLSHC
jgi:hypothetical protein